MQEFGLKILTGLLCQLQVFLERASPAFLREAIQSFSLEDVLKGGRGQFFS